MQGQNHQMKMDICRPNKTFNECQEQDFQIFHQIVQAQVLFYQWKKSFAEVHEDHA